MGGHWKATEAFVIAEDTALSMPRRTLGFFICIRSVPTREAEAVGDEQEIYCTKWLLTVEVRPGNKPDISKQVEQAVSKDRQSS